MANNYNLELLAKLMGDVRIGDLVGTGLEEKKEERKPSTIGKEPHTGIYKISYALTWKVGKAYRSGLCDKKWLDFMANRANHNFENGKTWVMCDGPTHGHIKAIMNKVK